jgi:hypothetical protein
MFSSQSFSSASVTGRQGYQGIRRVARTKCVPVKIVCGADVSAATPFWSSTEYLPYDSLRLDCAKSLLGVEISIPGSDRVRPPWRIGVLRRFSRYSCTSASSSPRLKAELRPCRAFPLLFAFSALCAAFAFRFGVRGWSRNRLTILLAYVRPLVMNEPLIRPASRRPVSFGRRPACRKSPEWG